MSKKLQELHALVKEHPFRLSFSLKDYAGYSDLLTDFSSEAISEYKRFNKSRGVADAPDWPPYCHDYNAAKLSIYYRLRHGGDLSVPISFIESVISQFHYYLKYGVFNRLSCDCGDNHNHSEVIYLEKHNRWVHVFRSVEAVEKSRGLSNARAEKYKYDNSKFLEELDFILEHFSDGEHIYYEQGEIK